MIDGQYSMFCGNEPVKITKPIRLIELFAGIGAQAKALENLGVPFEHYRVCEIDKYAVRSYNAIHNTDFETSDITQIHADDLGIKDTEHYCYIMTYSFPCQDISGCGKMQGFSKGEGTRSGLLWEIERIFDEIIAQNKELPQLLLMENVPNIHSKRNMEDWNKWLSTLSDMGYVNHWADLNARDYEIPQNRNRCFCVSVLEAAGMGTDYEFPKPVELKLRLKDMLDDPEAIEERYYLSDEAVQGLLRQLDRPVSP